MVNESHSSVFVIGAGAVGVGLAQALRGAGFSLKGVWNRGAPGRERAREILGADIVFARLGPELAHAQLILVCVSDSALSSVGAALRATGHVRPDAVVAHTSGCRPASALGAIPRAHLGSIHPLVAIPDPERAAELLGGATYAVEGTAPARACLSDAVRALGGQVFLIEAAQKARYHAAAVMASNLVVALLDQALGEAEAAAVPNARALLTRLAVGALRHLDDVGPAQALTGPVARGDTETILEHVRAMDPLPRSVYVALSTGALELARQRGLSEERIAAIQRVLETAD